LQAEERIRVVDGCVKQIDGQPPRSAREKMRQRLGRMTDEVAGAEPRHLTEVSATGVPCLVLWDTQEERRAVIKRADGHGA
jgi:hypothetical protein